MSSLIPGFEYDVFISYRQKDNKGEHWVTEFVYALKTELEATFKEDISIYFDENAHDGLLATHDVDDSLKNKLRCLIFIPIVSQTYCDPKSFAWNHEFLVFKKLASEDAYGLKIKLKNGNVASRILPVRIHELDPKDKAILENEIGPMRAVDFIFNSPGVNRPLRRVDLRADNTNKCIYHDQVNKVANGVKEIIDGIRNSGEVAKKPASKESQPLFYGTRKKTVLTKKIMIGLVLLLGVILSTYYLLVVRKNENPAIGKSIAVLPFVDVSPGHDQEYLSEGLSDEIRNTLSRIKDLKVAGRTSSFVFKGVKADLKDVGKRLAVSTVLEGTIQKFGNMIRISVQLSNAEDGYTIWSESSNRELNQILKVEADVAGNVATQIVDALNLTLTPQERRGLTKRYTENTAAYELYRKGWLFWDKRDRASLDSAEAYFKRALKVDPEYALAYAGLADCSEFKRGSPDRLSAKSYLAKALSLDSTLSEALATTGLLQCQDNDWTLAKKTLQKAIALNPNYPFAHLYYGNLLLYTGENTQQGIEETKKALELDPLSRWMNWVLGRNYYLDRQYDLAHEQLVKTLAIDSTFYSAKLSMGLILLKQKKYAEAIPFIKRFGRGQGIELSYAYAVSGDELRARNELKRTLAENPISDRQYSPFDSPGHLPLARAYAALGDYDEALMHLELANERREIAMYWVYIDPDLDPLRNEPRFKALMKKMNLK